MPAVEKITREISNESLSTLEDSSLLEHSGEIKSTLSDRSNDTELEVPTGVEEVEVHGEAHQPDDDWMDIIGSGDLKKKVVVPGIVETRPVRGDSVCIELTMKLSDGTLVEEAHTLYFTLGDSEVIQGLDLVVPLMDKGEVSEVYIDSRFAFGSKGEEGKVPCNMSLLCTVKLLDYKPEDNPEELTLAERQQIGNRKRVRGNWWFNRGDYSEAVQCYKAAVDFLDDTEDITLDKETRPEVLVVLQERLKALNNMAAAQIKLGAYDAALASVGTVLQCQPDNVKALFRRGKAQAHIGNTSEAVASLKQALRLEPENRAIHTELSRLAELARSEASAEKSLYRRMLGITRTEPREKDRYRTLRSFPWRVFIMSFMTIVTALVAYNNRDALQALLLLPPSSSSPSAAPLPQDWRTEH